MSQQSGAELRDESGLKLGQFLTHYECGRPHDRDESGLKLIIADYLPRVGKSEAHGRDESGLKLTKHDQAPTGRP